MNRLADTTSPYLLQHADNPVDWWPWCDEAFAEAERRDVPVLLSIGYSSCHWCHVMAHESFEDAETAALMNERFVNIKVDREERPDVDSVYMEATQAMTGQGGWPMTVFCTPAGEPFYCGTYFPRPSFHQVIEAVNRAWRERRGEVVTQGQRVVAALTERAPRLGGGPAPDKERLDTAVEVLADGFDDMYAGFGGAPKFPPSMVLEFLLRHEARTGDERGLSMVDRTCEAMARGGMYDQLGGGFARYATDRRWVVPHFEKMLYDNALLLRTYTHWWRRTGAPLTRRVATSTADWLLREMRTPQGGFASAIDADSEGVEGKYYVWTPAELRETLGEDDAAWAAALFGVTGEGTFERGSSVLQLRGDPDDPRRYERVRRALLGVRSRRVPPGRDDKVVAAWNGLAIAALAETGALFDRPDLVRAAAEAAFLLRDMHMTGGRLVRTSRDGVASRNPGVLEDYGDVAEGLLALHAVTGDPEWVRLAGGLLDTVLAHFGDGSGGLYDTADDAERLVRRPQDPTDNAAPSGQFAAAGALLSYAALTGSARHREAAEGVLGTVNALADRVPRFVGWGLAVAEALVAGPLEVAVVGPRGDDRTDALHRTALMSPSPGAVIALGEPNGHPDVPLLRQRGLVGGSPAAYVCRGFVCQAPTTDPEELRNLLRTLDRPSPRRSPILRLLRSPGPPRQQYLQDRRAGRGSAGRGPEVAGEAITCNHHYMTTENAEELRGWFAGRLPNDWFEAPPEIVLDREEITVIGRLPAPEVAGNASDAERGAAVAGRVQGFREDTRDRRIAIAREAEHRFRRKVSWGVECGGEREMFTTLSVPVMTRLRQPERQVLDTLVGAGVARSRSEALAWCVRLVGDNADRWLADLRDALGHVERVREAGPGS